MFVGKHSRNQLQTLQKVSREMGREQLPWQLGNFRRVWPHKGEAGTQDPSHTRGPEMQAVGQVLSPGLKP